MLVFIDTPTTFDSVGRHALWHCLLRNGVTEKYVSIPREFCRNTPSVVRAYGQLSHCSSSPVEKSEIANFLLGDALENALSILLDGAGELFTDNRGLDLE